ncbi:MAG: pyridoxal phosphate-dependent aminotransferase, partial [Halobacteriaceae archaeon]
MPQSGIREIFDKIQQYDEIYDLSIGEPDFNTPEPIAEAVASAVGSGAGSYTSTVGRADLREAIASKLDTENEIQADPTEEIIVTSGAMGALFSATQVLCNSGDEVIVPGPYWPNYEGHLRNTGASLVSVSTSQANGFVPTADDIEAAISDDTVGILLNSPTNPTGAVIPPEILKDIGEIVTENNLWIILDETYEDLVYESINHHSLASDPNLFEHSITIHSFSKSYAMTGWRIGYASGPADVISRMRILQEHTISCAAEPSQVAAKVALENPAVKSQIHEAFANRREIILERLQEIPNISVNTPYGAFYVFVDISSLMNDSYQFVEELIEEERVAGVPG